MCVINNDIVALWTPTASYFGPLHTERYTYNSLRLIIGNNSVEFIAQLAQLIIFEIIFGSERNNRRQ